MLMCCNTATQGFYVVIFRVKATYHGKEKKRREQRCLFLHQLHHDHPSDPDSERSSLSTPLLAFPIGYLLIRTAGLEDGSALFAGLLWGYLVFIVVHYAVHRWRIEPGSWLYPTKMRHLTHHHLENCNYGVTTIFWDVVFRTNAREVGGRIPSC